MTSRSERSCCSLFRYTARFVHAEKNVATVKYGTFASIPVMSVTWLCNHSSKFTISALFTVFPEGLSSNQKLLLVVLGRWPMVQICHRVGSRTTATLDGWYAMRGISSIAPRRSATCHGDTREWRSVKKGPHDCGFVVGSNYLCEIFQ